VANRQGSSHTALVVHWPLLGSRPRLPRDGRVFACEVEKLDQIETELREKCRAVRFEITHPVLKPDGPDPAEVLRTAPSRDIGCPDLSTSSTETDWLPPWMIPAPAEGASSTRAPPDG
jgi:hypothetical protein